MKKIAAILLAMISILACSCGCTPNTGNENKTTSKVQPTLPLPPASEETTIQYFINSNYRYFIVDGGINIKYYLGEETRVTVPSEIDGHKVRVLGPDSFYQKTEMKEVNIPATVSVIEAGAFYRCYSMEKAYIHRKIEKIGSNPYFRCSSLKEIKVDPKNEKYCDVDGVLFNKDKTVLIAYPEGKKLDTYKIPYGVKTIGEDAFGYWPEISKVYIPNTVTEFPINRISAHLPDDLTLIVEKGSPALEYAIKNNLKYEIKK